MCFNAHIVQTLILLKQGETYMKRKDMSKKSMKISIRKKSMHSEISDTAVYQLKMGMSQRNWSITKLSKY